MAVLDGVPPLEDWITLPAAAVLLGVTKQGVHGMAAAGKFATIHTVSQTAGVERQRSLYVVRRSEVERMIAEREGQVGLALAAMARQSDEVDSLVE